MLYSPSGVNLYEISGERNHKYRMLPTVQVQIAPQKYKYRSADQMQSSFGKPY